MILPLIQHIETLFKSNRTFIDKEGKLFIPKILEAIDKVDSELIKLLMSDTQAKEQFFTQVEGVYVLKQNDLIEFFTMNEYFNHSFTSYTNKIGLIKKDNFIKKFDDVVLAFPYKDCVLEGGQTKDDDKKNEVFYNSIISRDEIDRLFEPKVLTNIKRFDQDGEHSVEEIKEEDNLIIKGNNLLTLHCLKKRYAGKVKLIYIDPPYNTGNDSFQYNDNFNHSTWLTFMKNRLEVARDFLSEDGVIFISIDDDESHYLKILCDEIFGKENFVTNVIWEKKYTLSNDAKWFSDNHDHILVYSVKKERWKPNLLDRTSEMNKRYSNPDNHPKGVWKATPLHAKSGSNNGETFVYTFKNGIQWTPPLGTYPRFSKDTFNELDQNNEIWFGKDGNAIPSRKTFLIDLKNSGVVPKTIWRHEEAGHNHEAKEEVKKVLKNNTFSTPKPEKLLQRIIHLSTNKNDLVMDFHLGSGTTCTVAHKMNRRYIGIEQMDYIEDIAVERMKKVIAGEQGGISKAVNWKGGGSFVYAELKSIDNFTNSPIAKLNKNMQYLPISEIEDEEYGISPKEINLNKKFYGLDNE